MSYSTNIVKTKKFTVTERMILVLLMLLSGVYFYVLESDFRNRFLDIIFGIIYLVTITLALGQSLIKPKKIGNFSITNKGLKIKTGKELRTLKHTEIKSIFLKYSGYGSFWRSHSPYGNKNFIIIFDHKKNKTELEILIKNKNEKNKLKSEFTSTSLKEKFSYCTILNTKLQF